MWGGIILGGVLGLVRGTEENIEGPIEKDQKVREVIDRGQRRDPVIFEPIKSVRLSRSTFRVVSYVDFAPYQQSFKRFRRHLKAFARDLNSTDMLLHFAVEDRSALRGSPFSEGVDDMLRKHCGTTGRLPHQWVTSTYDKVTYQCHLLRMWLTMQRAVEHMQEVFGQIQNRFLAAVDHFEYHPTAEWNDEPEVYTTKSPPQKEKRSVGEDPLEGGWENTPVERDWVDKVKVPFLEKKGPWGLTPGENKHLRLVMKILGLINIWESQNQGKVEDEAKRAKRNILLDIVLGFGVFSNARANRNIRQQLKVLQQQNILQEDQIRELTYYLNLTRVAVNDNRQILYEFDVRLIKVNHTLAQMTNIIKHVQYWTSITQEIRSSFQTLGTGLHQLAQNVEGFYEYLRALSTHRVNPLIIPPDKLRKTLIEIQTKIGQDNPRLDLPEDPNTNIWAYYPIMRVTPVVMDSQLVVLLSIPLVDRSLEMTVYRVHNLPSVDQSMGVQFVHQLEGEYLAIDKKSMYVSVPGKQEVELCIHTDGYLCSLDSALYPTQNNKWCIYALFVQDREAVRRNCKPAHGPPSVNRAISLSGFLWAISTIDDEEETITVRCLESTYFLTVYPPMTIIEVPTGCEAFGNGLYVPAKNEMYGAVDTEKRVDFFLAFNEIYTNLTRYGVWADLELHNMTQEEIGNLAIHLRDLPPMALNHLKKKLVLMSTKEPWIMKPNHLLFVLAAEVAVTIGAFVVVARKMKSKSKAIQLLTGQVAPLVSQAVPILQKQVTPWIRRLFRRNPPTPPPEDIEQHPDPAHIALPPPPPPLLMAPTAQMVPEMQEEVRALPPKRGPLPKPPVSSPHLVRATLNLADIRAIRPSPASPHVPPVDPRRSSTSSTASSAAGFSAESLQEAAAQLKKEGVDLRKFYKRLQHH